MIRGGLDRLEDLDRVHRGGAGSHCEPWGLTLFMFWRELCRLANGLVPFPHRDLPQDGTSKPVRKQVEVWQRNELTDATANVVIYEAFVEGRLELRNTSPGLSTTLYFEPKHKEFRSRTVWSLSNAFTSAFQDLDPVPQFRATRSSESL